MADPLSRLILHAKQPLPPGSSCMRQDSAFRQAWTIGIICICLPVCQSRGIKRICKTGRSRNLRRQAGSSNRRNGASANRGQKRLPEENNATRVKMNGSKLPIGCMMDVGQDGKTEILELKIVALDQGTILGVAVAKC